MKKQTTLTQEQQQERENMRTHFFNEEMEKPLDYIIHSTMASQDQDLQELRDDLGKEALASFWMLAEFLARQKTKAYKVQTDKQWKRLTATLEYDTIEECKTFIEKLYELRLINRHSFKETNTIISNRICRNAEKMARDIAERRVFSWWGNKIKEENKGK